jgi:ribosomal subunit interface protein
MKVIVQAKSLKVTRALREFIERHSQKLSKLGQNVTAVRVYLEQSTRKSTKNKSVLVKFKIEVPGQDLWIEVAGYDFYDAIVDAINAATRKLRKSKEKQLDQLKFE